MYDPRREERRARTRVPLPEDVQPTELDQEVRRSLLTLSRETADLVARHLVMAGRLLDDDPEQALTHARAAGALAGRVAVVREAVGLAAYAAGEWAEALSELRAARRMSGSPEVLPVLADCERALGRPERALALLDDPDVPRLEQATRVELVIVVAGARRDLGQQDAAVLLLQGPARATTARRPWAARLWYAYADALLDAGRQDEAREWFDKAAEVDAEGATDAAERVLALDGVLFDEPDDEDAADDDRDGSAPLDGAELDELVAGMQPLEQQDAGAGAGAATGTGEPDGAAGDPAGSGPMAQSGPGAGPAAGAEDTSGSDEADRAAVLQQPLFGAPFSGTVQEEPPAPPRPAAVPGVAFVAAEDAEPGAGEPVQDATEPGSDQEG